MNTPTPDTDAAYTQRPNEGTWDFRVRQEKTMESLERERDEWKQLAIQYSAEAILERDEWKQLAIQAECEYNAMLSLTYKAERDEARGQRDRLADQLDHILLRLSITQERMIDAEKQRDRTAAALQSLRDCIQDTRGKDAYEAVRKADKALQSITPNEP